MNTTTSTIYTLSLHDALPIYENERVFDVRLRFQKEARDNAEKIGDILIPSSTGKKIPLSEIATIEYLTGPAFIYREGGSRYIARSESTRLNSSHVRISYAVFCLKKKKK